MTKPIKALERLIQHVWLLLQVRHDSDTITAEQTLSQLVFRFGTKHVDTRGLK